MEIIFSVLHIVGAVFLIGPMAILPMTGLRALRSGNAAQVRNLAKSTTIFSYLSLIVAVAGFGLVGMAPKEYNLSITTPWVLISIILYVIAIVLNLVLVVPAMRKAADQIEADGEASVGKKPAGYALISAVSGVVSLLLVAITVLMILKP